MRFPFVYSLLCSAEAPHDSPGTSFTPQNINTTDELIEFIDVIDQPFATTLPASFQGDVQELLALYPDDPALGSPFGTGNETFGLSPEYKRLASIVGDTQFQAPRRAWVNAVADAGEPVHAFLFADPEAVATPSLGVTHGTDVPYFYGTPYTSDPTAGAGELSLQMMDYVISFVTSLDPNDGKGSSRKSCVSTVGMVNEWSLRTSRDTGPNWPQYTGTDQTLLQFASASTTTITDSFRATQIAYIESEAAVFAQ